MADVSCVGILTADVLAKPLDSLPSKGLLSKVDQIQMSVGGCAANVAIDMAKLGNQIQIFGKTGDDSFGEFIRTTLEREGVQTSGVLTSATSQTSASVVAINEDGERSIMHCVGANAELHEDEMDLEAICDAKILFIAGTFLMPGFDGADTARLLQKAKTAGVLCCLDTAWDASGGWMNTLCGCLPYLDWFMPSYEEAVQLSGETEPEKIADIFHRMGAANVVVKLGGDGCYVKPETESGFFVKAYQAEQVMDTSGAGDSFCAGFLTGLLQGWTPEKCAQFANAVGCFCVGSVGTTSGIPTKQDVLSFISERERSTM